MTLHRFLPKTIKWTRSALLVTTALALAACAEVDDTTGTRLNLPAPGGPPRKPADMGDIAIVGQEVSHAIVALPAIADAPNPPLVQFTGVTSIIGPVPVDTDPYTELLRDRLLLLTREKLRFVERTLPPLVTSSKKKKHSSSSAPVASSDPDYQILAELRGKSDDDLYKIEVQFVDAHTNDVLFDGLYRIRKEVSDDSGGGDTTPAMPPPSDDPNYQPQPTPSTPAGPGNPGVQ